MNKMDFVDEAVLLKSHNNFQKGHSKNSNSLVVDGVS